MYATLHALEVYAMEWPVMKKGYFYSAKSAIL